MQVITESYRNLNKHLHETNAAYGTSAGQWTGMISRICRHLNIRNVLDYGCGKRELEKRMRTFSSKIKISPYDPAVPGLDAIPAIPNANITAVYGLTAVLDVMEHIELECLDAVLDHIADNTQQMIFFVIATAPAKKTLADGRNAHLIVESGDWWEKKIAGKIWFTCVDRIDIPGKAILIFERKSYQTELGKKPYKKEMYGC